MPTYCTAEDVRLFLNLQTAFSTTTKPTLAKVESIIEQKEDFIDHETGHSWRVKTVEDEYLDPFVECGVGARFDLRHRKIRDVSANLGDKIEVFDGNTFIQYLVSEEEFRVTESGDDTRVGEDETDVRVTEDVGSTSTKVEGRDEDFFIDYTNGVVYIRDQYKFYPKGFRMTYRYGDDIIPGDIKEACEKSVAMDILSMLDQAVNFADDGTSIRPVHGNRIQQWRDRVDQILDSRKELKTVTI